MTRLDEIFALEQRLNDLLKAQAKVNLQIAQSEDNIEQVAETIRMCHLKIEHHHKMLRHVRTVADVINLKEYIEIRKKLMADSETLADAQELLGKFVSGVNKSKRYIKTVAEDVALVKTQLASYGQVVPFAKVSS